MDAQVLRFLLAAAHYRRPIKFSDRAVEEARNNLEKIRSAYNNAQYRLEAADSDLSSDQADLAVFEALEARFVKEMDDDFQADNAMTVIYQFVKELNMYSERDQVSQVVLEKALSLLEQLMMIFGIKLQADTILDDDIQALIDERTQARQDKNFSRSDEIRDYLKEQGIILDDTNQGTRWRRA